MICIDLMMMMLHNEDIFWSIKMLKSLLLHCRLTLFNQRWWEEENFDLLTMKTWEEEANRTEKPIMPDIFIIHLSPVFTNKNSPLAAHSCLRIKIYYVADEAGEREKSGGGGGWWRRRRRRHFGRVKRKCDLIIPRPLFSSSSLVFPTTTSTTTTMTTTLRGAHLITAQH